MTNRPYTPATLAERWGCSLMWWWCKLAFALVVKLELPMDWRLTKWLLPYAGLYAYSDSFHDYLRDQSNG